MGVSLAEIARSGLSGTEGQTFTSPPVVEREESSTTAKIVFLNPFRTIADDHPGMTGEHIKQLGLDCLLLLMNAVPQAALLRLREEIQTLSNELTESSDPRVQVLAEIAPGLAGLTQESTV